ncbi:MAG: hypothetical protein AAFS10_13245, partial [Myxococcota bacterium]
RGLDVEPRETPLRTIERHFLRAYRDRHPGLSMGELRRLVHQEVTEAVGRLFRPGIKALPQQDIELLREELGLPQTPTRTMTSVQVRVRRRPLMSEPDPRNYRKGYNDRRYRADRDRWLSRQGAVG